MIAMGRNSRVVFCMPRITRRTWTPDQIELLRLLLDKGVSAARASVVLKRPKLAVQDKARQLGTPFPDVREVRAARLAKEVFARKSAEQREALSNHRR
jgi:hypothetical protein